MALRSPVSDPAATRYTQIADAQISAGGAAFRPAIRSHLRGFGDRRRSFDHPLRPEFPRTQGRISAVDALRQIRTDWIGLLIILALLGVTATATAVTVYSYFATKEKLAKIQTTAKAILESLVGGVLTLGTEGGVTIINRAASSSCWK